MALPIITPDLLLARGATLKKVNKGEVIFREGTYCCFYYQVLSGEVRWINVNEDGVEYLQSIIGEGESFGEIPLFDNGPYVSTAIANEETILIRLSKNAFLDLIREQPDVHMRFTQLITERLRFKFMITKEIATYGPEHCISSLLRYFKENNKHLCPECNKIILTRQQIADMTGLRVETVIRAIRQLHAQKKLSINKGKVYF